MYITEIELQNFKSFGKKVKIPLFDDFTAISGPNGSGKSNIVDALLFALGLSNSRTMRAEKLTDLIYNGGEKKDFAQVTIRFDNTDREMPVDSDYVTISRKVKKTESGYYSYYYFNDAAVGLNDIHNYLAKARITPECYNVIIQGDVTRIIEMTPTERRKIIDEIAGVAEFDEKKEQALRELEIVRERIERVDIILAEVDDQLKKLIHERDQALKYQSLKDERKKYEGFVLIAKLKSAEKELDAILNDVRAKEEEKDKNSLEFKEIQQKIADIEENLKNLNSQILKKGEDEQISIKKEIEGIRGEMARSQGIIELAENEINDIESRRRKIFIDISSTQGKVQELARRIEEESFRKETILSEFENQKVELTILKNRIIEIDAKYADKRDKLSDLKNRIESVKSEKNEIIREEDRLLDSARRKSSEARDIELLIQDSESKISTASLDEKKANAEIEDLTKQLKTARDDIALLEKNRAQIKAVVTEIDNKLRENQQEYARTEGRIKAASEMGYQDSVESVLRAKKNKEIPGIYGTVAELGKVDRKYSTALEIAAGARMQAVVVGSDADAARAIEYLKQNRLGRVTFLPLNKLARKNLSDLPKKEGIIDYAINLIDYDPMFDPAFWYVFRDSIVVSDLTTARRLMGLGKLVTMEGELIEKAGAMTGGSIKSKISFASREQDKLTLIAQQITENDSKRRAAQKTLDSIDARVSGAIKEINTLDNEITKKRLQLEEIAGRGTRLKDVIQAKQAELSEIRKVQAALMEEMKKIDERKQEKEKFIQELAEQIKEAEELLAGSEVPQLNAQASKVQDEMDRLQERVRDIEAGINALNLDKKYAETKIQESKELLSDLDNKKKAHLVKIASCKAEIENLKKILSEKSLREKELALELSELQKQREQVQEIYDSEKQKADELKKRLLDIDSKVQALSATKEALCAQVTELAADIEGRGLNRHEEIPDGNAISIRIASIDKAMEKLEPVNMRAIDEYNEVEKRQSELKSRRDTLFHEREEILLRIEKCEQMKKQAFMEAFSGINDQFKKVFAELSYGTGELVLENPEDPFSGGMTIRAQPSEKTLQRLEAMSGGEKSLTALSLIFAIQQFRPAPFYAFDEIDMFLDGVNADRVAKKIQRSANNAQFIVVSLRKPMIEASKRVIGVVMQENNMSSITGVKCN